MHHSFALLSSLVIAASSPVPLRTVQETEYRAPVKDASDDARLALAGFQVAEGFVVELFAAEPLLANPVIFTFDDQGRAYVCETFRHKEGVTDTRDHMSWLLDDLSCRTVADRILLIRRLDGGNLDLYTRQHERLRRVADLDADGVADSATVFSQGYQGIADGIAAGVLVHDGDVYYACIPDLWWLRDDDDDGRADRRRSLHTGFGVHINLLGHDLHGLCLGPDGRLYFSIGDRGFDVVHDGRHLSYPDAGAVLRCELDGSHLEVFAEGLRNPQELVFDEWGNLFTGDNNSDGGDKARFVYLVEGGDCGWRIGYQWLEGSPSRGPWNEEKLWWPPFEVQAAYILPPIANIASGPSGLAYHPGGALNGRLQRHFFLCDFRGEASISGVHCFTLAPHGAGFTLGPVEKFLWKCLVTDLEFAPDGNVYVSDWTQGWDKTGKGRLYRIRSDAGADAASAEVQLLLRTGFRARSDAECLALLAHADQRVRGRSQYELARRGTAVLDELWTACLDQSAALLGRVHALWAIGHVERRLRHQTAERDFDLARWRKLLACESAELRAQTLRVLADLRCQPLAAEMLALLRDPEPRVRLFAALAFRHLRHPEATTALLQLLETTADQDVYLRHAAVMGLTGQVDSGNPGLVDSGGLRRAAAHSSPAVRRGVLLAMRRLGDSSLVHFLNDPDPSLVLEAVRAIHDLWLEPATDALAALLDSSSSTELPLLRRALNANYRIGDEVCAQRIARFATRVSAPASMRTLAIQLLGEWASPGRLDKVLNSFRPLPDRGIESVQLVYGPVADFLIADADATVRNATLVTLRSLKMKGCAHSLQRVIASASLGGTSRALALKAIDELHPGKLADLLPGLLSDPQSELRSAAREALARVDPMVAQSAVESALTNNDLADQRSALEILASHPDWSTPARLAALVGAVLDGTTPPALWLEALAAADARANDAELSALAAQIRAAWSREDPELGRWFTALEGGDVERGRKLFFERNDANCLRCHKVGTQGNGEAGPDLATVAGRYNRKALLESLVLPNRRIAEGYHSEILALKGGELVDGRIVAENDAEIRMVIAQGDSITERTIQKSEVDCRKQGQSSMPGGLADKLDLRELRDLVEYLAALR